MENQTVRPYELNDAVELVLNSVMKQVRQKSAAPVLLGVSGIDCSGKTTLAKALLERASGEGIAAKLVSVDDFIIPQADRFSTGQPVTDYFEHTFDQNEFAAQVERLKQSGEVQLVIGEGVFLFRRELVGIWDQKCWLEMSIERAVRCGSVRDAELFGSPAQAKAEYLNRFMPAHEHHLQRDNPAATADFVFEVD